MFYLKPKKIILLEKARNTSMKSKLLIVLCTLISSAFLAQGPAQGEGCHREEIIVEAKAITFNDEDNSTWFELSNKTISGSDINAYYYSDYQLPNKMLVQGLNFIKDHIYQGQTKMYIAGNCPAMMDYQVSLTFDEINQEKIVSVFYTHNGEEKNFSYKQEQ